MPGKETNSGRAVYIVDGARTPFLKARLPLPGAFSASDLAVGTARELVARQPILPSDINEVVVGCMIPSADEANIARIIALRLGCGKKVPAFTVQRNCASGMQALDNAWQDIATGRHDLVLAGGTEAMSRAPLLFRAGMARWLAGWMKAKSFAARVVAITRLRLNLFAPIFALERGLTDAMVDLNMGQTAEILAHRFHITRAQMDEFAYASHQRLAAAIEQKYLAEITPLFGTDGSINLEDEGLRRDTTVAKLGELKAFFDRKYGNVTAGNSSQVTDGAAFVLLASAAAVKKFGLKVIGRIVDTEWAGVDPAQMGLGPVYATSHLLQRCGLTRADIDYWEINEAFAAQVLACLAAWEDAEFCKTELGLSQPFGKIDRDRLNVDGGAIAIGHPVGASGARIALHLLQVLRRNKAKRGVATICIGGGQGGAMLIENVEGVSGNE